MKFYNGILTVGILSAAGANAFVINNNNSHQQQSNLLRSSTSTSTSLAVSAEESAKAFTDYMAKSHVEKLKALKELEDKKNSEIEALKKEVKELKGGDVVLASQAPVVAGSVEELSAKLLAYQNFMSEYIVKAQEEKYKAVKAAEAAISKKYEDKLNTFMLSGSAPAEAAAAEGSKVYQQRNANVAAAAKAGKSRWGDKEVEKVAGVGVVTKAPPSTTTTAAVAVKEVPPASSETIAAADHGLRADGGVGGLTLEERVTNGAAAAAMDTPVNGSAVTSSQPTTAYDMRNANIAKAAKAGKQSRWGTKEVEKAVAIASNALPAAANGREIIVTPEIEAADHGLRADGGVTGPSLAERVNLGAQLL